MILVSNMLNVIFIFSHARLLTKLCISCIVYIIKIEQVIFYIIYVTLYVKIKLVNSYGITKPIMCNGVDITIILIYIFNTYFEPYLLLAFNVICVSWNMNISILYSFTFPVKSCPYSIKSKFLSFTFGQDVPRLPQWTGHGPSLVNEVCPVSARCPVGSCAVNLPLEAGQSWPIIAPFCSLLWPTPFKAHKKEIPSGDITIDVHHGTFCFNMLWCKELYQNI